MKEEEFLAAFKAIFWHQVRSKFGLGADQKLRERFLKPIFLLGYVILLYHSMENHHERVLILFTLIGCTWLSVTAIDSIKQIYHRRYTMAKDEQRVRDIDAFTPREKLFAYFISAFTLTGIFTTGMVTITFIRTGAVAARLFLGMVSVPAVILLEWFGFLGTRNG